MTPARPFLILAAGGSLLLLMGAFGFQHYGGLAPCKMCLWQRWPHAMAIILGLGALLLGNARLYKPLCYAGALVAMTTAAIGIYHTGVERNWWEGPTSCTSGGVGGVSAQDLLEQILAAPLIRCDEVAWEMLSLSMASWNALLSLILAGLWIMAARRG